MTTEQTRVDHIEILTDLSLSLCIPIPAIRELESAIAAITELLAADREYDERLIDYKNCSRYGGDEFQYFLSAEQRRSAALAAFAPQRAEQEAS